MPGVCLRRIGEDIPQSNHSGPAGEGDQVPEKLRFLLPGQVGRQGPILCPPEQAALDPSPGAVLCGPGQGSWCHRAAETPPIDQGGGDHHHHGECLLHRHQDHRRRDRAEILQHYHSVQRQGGRHRLCDQHHEQPGPIQRETHLR